MTSIPLPLEVQELFAQGRVRGETSTAMTQFDNELRRLKKLPGVPPTQFHSFSRLPLEMRLKIFRSMLPGPRIMPLEDDDIIKHVVCRVPPPKVLHISYEARREALRVLKLLFPISPIPFRARPIIYINPESDTIFFPNLRPRVDYPFTLHQMLHMPCGIDDLVCSSTLPIKRLSISGAEFESQFMGRGTPSRQPKIGSLKNFRALEVITLVFLPYDPIQGHKVRELDLEKNLSNSDRILMISALKSLQDREVFWKVLNLARFMVNVVAWVNPDWKAPELQFRVYSRRY